MDEGLLNDLLECSVCLERLDTSSRVLPCQHTFCIQCLREIIYCQKELRCPECRVLVETPVDELPPNVLLMRILEGMRYSGGQRSHSSPPPPQVVIPRRPIIGPATFMDPVSSYGFTYSDGDGKYTNVIPKCTPHARALYDYFSKEPGDLNFKKGEVIILRRQIDTFWYHGETGGNQGAFPITYAKIVVPLSPQIPQCTALYDFYMAAHEDEGCLAFNKGAVINVIRRVDENWAEGKLQDKIGIFPIAFVEMNGPALSIINSYNRGNNSSAINKPTIRSSPAPQLSKAQQLNYGQKQTVGSAILANQVGYRPQPMSISSPVPSMGVAVQRQQHNMSQSHPSYIHYQHHPHPNPEANKSGTPYIDLFEYQAGTHNRSIQQEPVSGDSHVKYSNIPMEVRAQTSSSQTEPNPQNKVKSMNPKYSNLPPNYNTNNNISSDSSSTTTTPSFGGSSLTTTPNTSSSNTSSASESNTPSSPASPAANSQQKPGTANNSPSLPQNQTIREESNEQGDISEQANVSNPDSNIRNVPQQSQSMNGNVLNITPPRSNMSSPQICTGGSNNSTLTPTQISSQLDNLQLNSSTKKNSSPVQNYVNIQPKSESQAGTSNHAFNSLYTFSDQLIGEHMISPMHGRKENNPLTATPRTSHSHHREREKRNSLISGGQIVSSHSTAVNRHSAEILGPSRNLLDQELSQDTAAASKSSDKHRFEKELGSVEDKNKKSSNSSNQYTSYVALYAYKPQKPDELELKKGGLYMVLEQCQDGWYKGCSCRTQKCGVFPGNYVIPVSKVQMGSSKNKQQASPSISKSTKESSSSSSSNKNKNVDMSQFQTPPDLPPRSHSPTLHKRSSPKSVPAKSSEKSKEKSKADKSVSSGVSLMKRLTGMKNRRSPPPTYTAGFSMDNPVFEDCSSENSVSMPPTQQAAPQQAIHTRSGSCPSQLLQGAPSGTMNAQMQTMPSYYYKTNENLESTVYGTQITVGGSVSSAVAHRLFPTHHMVKGMGSQTLGPSHGFGQVQRRQPRPTVLNALIGPDVSIPSNTNNVKQQQGNTIGRPSGEVPWFPAPTRHHHRKSHSLDAGQQLKPGKENSREPINKRFRCIVAYPPNSEYELELQVDDVVLVHKQWGEGWYKGTHERTGHTGLVPASFVEAC